MNSKTLSFNSLRYDPFIDFLKAYAIIMVVFTHCIPTSVHDYFIGCLWIDVQVPLFLLIQVFHAYKNNTTPIINANKIIKRIVLPFVTIQLAMFMILAIFSKQSIINLLKTSVLGGGMGLGPITSGYIYNLHFFYDGGILI